MAWRAPDCLCARHLYCAIAVVVVVVVAGVVVAAVVVVVVAAAAAAPGPSDVELIVSRQQRSRTISHL